MPDRGRQIRINEISSSPRYVFVSLLRCGQRDKETKGQMPEGFRSLAIGTLLAFGSREHSFAMKYNKAGRALSLNFDGFVIGWNKDL